MRLPKAKRQGDVVENLEKSVRAAMRKLEKGSIAGLSALWENTSRNLKASLLMEYKRATPHGRWDIERAKATGTLYRMERIIMRHMEDFKQSARVYIGKELKTHYDHEFLTSAYILDQVTPPNHHIKITPGLTPAHEAVIKAGPTAAIMWFQRFDGWASAYESALKQNIMLNAINGGIADSVAADVDATRAGTPAVTFWDAMGRLFLNEILAAQEAARSMMVGLNADAVSEEIWQTAEDEKVCEECGPLSGMTREKAEDEEPPLHPNCILPGNLVSCPDALNATKALYNGPIVKITFSDGANITVTENHPILTRQGWIKAKLITKSNEIVRTTNTERIVKSINPDYYYMPAAIEDIFNAAKMSSFVSTKRVEHTPEDFHGDGVFLKGQIDIVFIDRFLRNSINALTAKNFCKFSFCPTSISSIVLKCLGNLGAVFIRLLKSSNGCMRRAGYFEPLLTRKMAHADSVRLTTPSNLYPVRDKSGTECSPTDTNLASEFLLRFSSDVSFDKPVEIVYSTYKGHVYNLQSEYYRLYICNGVIVKNCRCFYRVMPKDWIELSKSDPALAHALDVAEAVPDGMYIRDEQGNIKAAAVVSFSDWTKDKLSVGGY